MKTIIIRRNAGTPLPPPVNADEPTTLLVSRAEVAKLKCAFHIYRRTKSASIRKQPAAEESAHGLPQETLEALRQLIERSEKDLWDIGDRINAMQDSYREQTGRKLSAKRIAAALNTRWTGQRVGQVAAAARFFPPALRAAGVSHHTHSIARQANDRLTEARRRSAEQIHAAMAGGCNTTRGITQWVNRHKETEDAREIRKTARLWHAHAMMDRPHYAPWEQIVVELPDGSLAAIWADPPFGRFARESMRRNLAVSGSAILSRADNADIEAARRTTFALFELLPSKLRPGAPLFLHQFGGSIDDPELIRFAQDRGWVAHCPLIWVAQASVSPDKMGDAFGSVCQRILVFTYGQSSLELVGTNPNSNVILDIPGTSRVAAQRVSRGKAERSDHHVFEHPPELPERVLRNVLPHDSRALVFEPFGCSAPGSVAAIRNGWDWVYCESYKENYVLGERRINAALDAAKQADNRGAA